MNGACDLQALSCQGSRQGIVMLARRYLREQGIDERLALLVSQLLVTLQASFQQDTRTSDRPLSQGDLSKEAKEPAGCPRVVGLSIVTLIQEYRSKRIQSTCHHPIFIS